MMVKGYVLNNSGRSKHIYKRTVYPGQRLDLNYIYKIVENKVPENESFVDWLKGNLPKGWEVNATKVETKEEDTTGGRHYKEVLTAVPEVHESEDSTPQDTYVNRGKDQRYATPRAIDKMTAREIHDLKLKDNPKRILSYVTSIHKLRRALSMCKDDKRKKTLIKLIQKRIRELNLTL